MVAIGDVVQLTGESAQLTVEKIEADDVHCIWMDKQNRLRRAVFPKECLAPFSRAEIHIYNYSSDGTLETPENSSPPWDRI